MAIRVITKVKRLKSLLLPLLLSLLLLWVLGLSFQQYQIGLLEKKANKLFPLLSDLDLFSFSPILGRVINQLDTSDELASQRHWQRGLLYEWQGGEDNLVKAAEAIELAIAQRPAWPFMWRDLMRIGWKQDISVEDRIELLRRFRRVGDWNKQSVAELAKLYLPRWKQLATEEQTWLSQQAPKVLRAYEWVEQTKLLVALKLVPEELCTAIEAEPEVLAGCAVDLSEFLSQDQ